MIICIPGPPWCPARPQRRSAALRGERPPVRGPRGGPAAAAGARGAGDGGEGAVDDGGMMVGLGLGEISGCLLGFC